MRLRRPSKQAVYFTHFAALADSLQDGSLILAELSGIPVEQRRAAADRLAEVCDSADGAAAAVVRALRENYATPFDRDCLYRLSSELCQAVHRLESVAFALSSSAFDEFPVGVLEMLAVLSDATDQTKRMLQRLSVKPDQWEYVDSVNRLFHRAEALRLQISDAVPAAKRGIVHLAAANQLGQTFHEAVRAFRAVGEVVAEIAVRES
ncbi:DUF47 family protein [Brevibacterium album]|uniref:DUF47 family protein n=1 Tax=Brevibacterium album TaxID=417948 RepID=UPI0004074AC8|nr:DUF47 family protein [Brevibacterium album]